MANEVKQHEEDSNEEDNPVLFDNILKVTGGLGRWQKFVVVIASWSCIIAATNHVSVLFLGATPKFSCADGNSSNSDDKCLDQYGEQCVSFTYDTSEYKTTLVTQWDLVCGRVFLLPIIQGTYFAGVILGNLLGGPASDVFGRRNTLMACCFMHIITSHSVAFIDDYFLFLAVRFIVGGTAHTMFSVLNIISLEVVPIDKRPVASGVFQLGWKVGFSILAMLGYFFRSWTSLQMAIAVLNIPTLLYFWIVPESPRWLLSAGRTSDAETTLRNIAKWNGVDGKVDFDADFDKTWKEVVRQHGTASGKPTSIAKHIQVTWSHIRLIMGTKLARNRFLLSMYPWFICGLAYYGIFLSVKFVNVDKYMLVVITGLVELPVLIIMVYVVNKIGRVWTQISAFTLGGIMGICLLATPQDDLWVRPILIVIGKAISAVYWLGVGLHSPEVFPTSVRNAAFCFLDACSKVGATAAPFVVDLLSTVDKSLPNIVIGILTLLATIPFLFLPETMNEDIPETIDDMAKMQDILANKMCHREKDNKHIEMTSI